jgi:PEP-CTERM motif
MEFQMKYFNKYAILVALSALSFGAQATSISNSSVGLTGTFTTEDFDTWVLGSSSGVSSPGLSFDSGQITVAGIPATYLNMSGNSISNSFELTSGFSFSGPVSGVAFNFVSDDGNATFTAFLGAVEVEYFTAATDQNGNFYGFKDIVFDSIRIGGDLSSFAYTYALDNLQVASSFDGSPVTQVPEPESYAMFMAGLALMGFIARRRKNGQS